MDAENQQERLEFILESSHTTRQALKSEDIVAAAWRHAGLIGFRLVIIF